MVRRADDHDLTDTTQRTVLEATAFVAGAVGVAGHQRERLAERLDSLLGREE